jgi:RNA polymerase sigma-70 factor (ECF subfamily)
MAVSPMPDARVRLSDDVASFYDAIAPHVDKMRRVAARLAGLDNRDDVVQDALLQAWRARAQFDPDKGTLSAWLLAITAHQASKVRRRIRFLLFPARQSEVGMDDSIDVRGAVERLARREKLAVDCFYFADLSIAETAAVMGCSEGTVKSTLSSARERLRGLLK